MVQSLTKSAEFRIIKLQSNRRKTLLFLYRYHKFIGVISS